MIKRWLIGGLMAGMVLCAGCASLIREPRVDVRSTDIVGADSGGFDLEVLAAIANPNLFDVTLQGYTFDLQVMAVPFASGGQQKTIIFKAGQTTEVRLPFRVRHSELAGILKRLPDPDHIPYQIDARLVIATPVGEQVVPLTRKDTFSIPEAYRPATYLKQILKPLGGMF